jgi:hypothetical protein
MKNTKVYERVDNSSYNFHYVINQKLKEKIKEENSKRNESLIRQNLINQFGK